MEFYGNKKTEKKYDVMVYKGKTVNRIIRKSSHFTKLEVLTVI